MGNGTRVRPCRRLASVHPHAYGERSCSSRVMCSINGSSPRIWGTVFLCLQSVPISRFIPTHMGNGLVNRSIPFTTSVHPHAYGERIRVVGIAYRCGGSSPRIWGTASGKEAPDDDIPVHPHAYGERRLYSASASASSGSSPRIWGTALGVCVDPTLFRFIPTHMGNGPRRERDPASPTVHPHAYGERTGSTSPLILSVGSSPRIWGTGRYVRR